MIKCQIILYCDKIIEMTTDWNWFFSSFSQSAAALIGIIAAFIISRLLGASEKINIILSDFDNLLIDYDKIISSINKRHFRWFTKRNVQYSSKLKEAIRSDSFKGLSENEVVELVYKIVPGIYNDDTVVLEVFKELSEDLKPRYIDLSNGISTRQPDAISKFDIAPKGLWDKLDAEREQIDQLEIQSKSLIQYFQKNLQSLESFSNTLKPLRIIIIILMLAFPITVVYPLHFMPMASDVEPKFTFNPIAILKTMWDFKSLMLFLFLIGIESIFYYFLFITSDLEGKLKSGIEHNRSELRDIKFYSEYF